MENFGIFYGHLVYFMAIWYILRPFGKIYGIVCGNLVYSPSIMYNELRNIWQP
jgi:hypothetical protein